MDVGSGLKWFGARGQSLLAALLPLAASLLLGGCFLQESRSFILKPYTGESGKRLVWPPAADRETPRYVYVGELIGDPNYVPDEPDSDAKKVKAAVNWFLGEVIFGEEEQQGLSRPISGIVDATGRILVTDMGRGVVMVFDEVAGNIQEWFTIDKTRRIVTPIGIAQGPEGSVLVSDADHGFIVRFNREGKTIGLIGEHQLRRPTGIAYEPETRRLYVVDTQSHDIKVFDLSGRLLDIWGDRGGGENLPAERLKDEDEELHFNMPTHVAVAKGKLYVTDTLNARVQVIDTKTGGLLRVIGQRGWYVGNMVRPKGVAVDSEENIYVIEGYHDHMLVYDRKGRFLMSIGGEGVAPGRFNLPMGLWIDARDRIYVADSHNRRVQIFQFLGGGEESDDD